MQAGRFELLPGLASPASFTVPRRRALFFALPLTDAEQLFTMLEKDAWMSSLFTADGSQDRSSLQTCQCYGFVSPLGGEGNVHLLP